VNRRRQQSLAVGFLHEAAGGGERDRLRELGVGVDVRDGPARRAVLRVPRPLPVEAHLVHDHRVGGFGVAVDDRLRLEHLRLAVRRVVVGEARARLAGVVLAVLVGVERDATVELNAAETKSRRR
jgi:hypothetical protein